MPDSDHYQAYYRDKLWKLLPAIYRTLDSDSFSTNGPLREMVNRIGAQAAVLRRSIDRLWEDQSIETCDDWVIPYIADLLATNLVSSLDARGQRLDVAKTIYYRRRKGTLAVLEEIAADITGWDAHVVEFFRRLGRTWHNFDPPVGTPAQNKVPATQAAATGDGATTTFSFNLAHNPVSPGTLQVVVAGTAAGTDDGSGAIAGGGLSGTIDYGSGAMSLTFVTAPAGGAAVTVEYEYISYDITLQLAEGLIGSLTHSEIGGWADLRNAYGATRAHTAYDEYFHTADFRRGVDRIGWHNIPRLGVFLWRLISLGVDPTTPVAMTACPGQYSFDPTGRQIPLFAAAERTESASYGESWVSPQEWQLPQSIATALLQVALKDPQNVPLYATVSPDGSTVTPNSLGVFTFSASGYSLIDPSHFIDPATGRSTIFPELGRFHVVNPPMGEPLFVTYHYGFSSAIGAGPYDRRLPGVAQPVPPTPVTTVSGGNPVTAPSPAGTLTVTDSLTYTNIADVAGIQNVMIQAAAEKRSVFRLPVAALGVNSWTLTGTDGSVLQIAGLLISGGDIVLSGKFASVTFTCCTLDPGNSGQGSVFEQSVDQRDLRPCRLWIEAEIGQLTFDRCIIGPVHTRNGGNVETLSANDSILQGIRTSGYGALTADDVQDLFDLALDLRAPQALSAFLRGSLDSATLTALNAWNGTSPMSASFIADVLNGLNTAMSGPSLYQSAWFATIDLSPATQALLATNPSGTQLLQLNRMLLEEVFPVALGQAALGLDAGEVNLNRCTILGRMFVHRLEASECILNEFAVVDDTQHGCVRFSAWAVGSLLPRQYESVEISDQSPIFTSRQFGQPGYGQLLASADAAILTPAGATILAGAQNGSEMGAFARDKNPIKDRSVLIKYQEYMPLGLVPVLIHVT